MEFRKLLSGLFQSSQQPSHTPDKNSLLFDAIFKHDAEKMKALLDSGADVNARGELGATPLIWCVREGYLEGLNLLMQKNPDLTAQDQDELTAFEWANDLLSDVQSTCHEEPENNDAMKKFKVFSAMCIQLAQAQSATPKATVSTGPRPAV